VGAKGAAIGRALDEGYERVENVDKFSIYVRSSPRVNGDVE
jgi:hypothetical protein